MRPVIKVNQNGTQDKILYLKQKKVQLKQMKDKIHPSKQMRSVTKANQNGKQDKTLYLKQKSVQLKQLKDNIQLSTDEKSVVNKHCSDIETKFAVGITESQEKLPTFYWLPKLHKRPYKARFIANSSSCTTTCLSKVLTFCLTAIKNHWIKYCEKTYEREGINYFWSIKKLY